MKNLFTVYVKSNDNPNISVGYYTDAIANVDGNIEFTSKGIKHSVEVRRISGISITPFIERTNA